MHLVLGRAHLAEGLYGEAVEECRRAIRLAPELADALSLVRLRARRDRAVPRGARELGAVAADGGPAPAGAEQRREVADARAAAASLERLLGGERA